MDLEIESGTAVGLLGPNGAGKTTTIKSLLGLIVPTNGRVAIHGKDVHDSPAETYNRVGAVLEGARNTYWRLTVRENLEFFSALAGQSSSEAKERQAALLEQFSLEDKAEQTVKNLSRGEKQKVSIACTLARDVDVIFLDEPTLGLDVESTLDLRRELRTMVNEQGTTLLVSSHDMDVIEHICDRVVIMNDGEIIADDTVENLFDVFDTQQYEITVDDPFPPAVRETVIDEYHATNFNQREEATRFTVKVIGDEFYDFVNTLQAADVSVDTVTAVEPDLEEIFLRVTDDQTTVDQESELEDGEDR